jgi:hypothetical protein
VLKRWRLVVPAALGWELGISARLAGRTALVPFARRFAMASVVQGCCFARALV